MKEILVKIEKSNDLDVVSSRTVAEQLGKQHKHVLESIENILQSLVNKESRNLGSLKNQYFIENNYKIDGQLRTYKEYLLTKDGFTLYMFNIQGYNDFKMAYINEFNRREKEIQNLKNQYQVPKTFKKALLLAVNQQEQIELLENKIEQDKPRVSFAETIEKASDCILVREFSKILGNDGIHVGEKKIYQQLRNWGYILLNSTEPTQRAMQQGLFKINERLVKTVKGDMLTKTTLITGKGQLFLLEKFKKHS